MKTVAPHDRPREKLERLGAAGLGDNELLAIVLGHGMPRAGVLELANAVLDAAGGLNGLVRASVHDLCRIPGIGAARASQLIAAIEAGRRSLVRATPERLQIVSPRDAAMMLLPLFGTKSVEQFGVLLLDTRHRVLRTVIVSVGSLDTSVVHPREVFREATSGGASAVVLFHNHPSGDPTPSADDVILTLRLIAVGDLLGITVIDHVILAENRYCSLRERGDLKKIE